MWNEPALKGWYHWRQRGQLGDAPWLDVLSSCAIFSVLVCYAFRALQLAMPITIKITGSTGMQHEAFTSSLMYLNIRATSASLTIMTRTSKSWCQGEHGQKTTMITLFGVGGNFEIFAEMSSHWTHIMSVNRVKRASSERLVSAMTMRTAGRLTMIRCLIKLCKTFSACEHHTGQSVLCVLGTSAMLPSIN
jgi:hypothetical protein